MKECERDRHDPSGEISRRQFVRVSALAAGGALCGACSDSPTGPLDPRAVPETSSLPRPRFFDDMNELFDPLAQNVFMLNAIYWINP
jgi:hypothetical protein